MHSCGVGYSGSELFCALMNIPQPMASKAYDLIVQILATACMEVAKDSMNDATLDIRLVKTTQQQPSSSSDNPDMPDPNPVSIVDTSISIDGSWQKQGYSLLNGYVAAVSMDTGKVLDVEVMSRSCKPCNQNKDLENTDPNAFAVWKANHTCSMNYQGSAPNMEVTGAKKIFSRSITERSLRYVQMFSDGDSKTFPAIKNTYLEGDVLPKTEVQKKECIGHVQKRVGTRLRKLKKEVKGLKGKLTEKTIVRLQNFYGIAIRSNPGNLKGMQDNVMAVVGHVGSSTKNCWHDKCPTGADSWCGYQRDKANNTKTYKPDKGLAPEVIKYIKPVFIDLAKDDLLIKCLDCKTQNQNESFNGTVWNRLPKTTYVGYKQFQLGVYDAVAMFNMGRNASIRIYEKMGMRAGMFMRQGCRKKNNKLLYFGS